MSVDQVDDRRIGRWGPCQQPRRPGAAAAGGSQHIARAGSQDMAGARERRRAGLTGALSPSGGKGRVVGWVKEFLAVLVLMRVWARCAELTRLTLPPVALVLFLVRVCVLARLTPTARTPVPALARDLAASARSRRAAPPVAPRSAPTSLLLLFPSRADHGAPPRRHRVPPTVERHGATEFGAD